MIEKLTLPNGLRILMEPLPYLRTACFGVWVASGAVDEEKGNSGISHFIEHMAFKGTSRYTSAQLAEAMDSIGGQSNAFTTKEYTCFYAHTLSEHVEEGFRLLAQMLTDSTLPQQEMETEKGVVLEEISMSEDDPEDLVGEQLIGRVWAGAAAGRPILGSRETVKSFRRETLQEYMARRYTGKRIVISICGSFFRDKVVSLVEEYFGGLPAGEERERKKEIEYRQSVMVTPKRHEQTYLCLAFPGLAARHEERFAMAVLNLIAGGSSSSRLFRRVREELGLAYAIYSDIISMSAGGLFCVQASVSPKSVKRALREIRLSLEGMKEGVEGKEFLRAKEHLKSGILMGTENAASRVGYNGRGELLYGETLDEDWLLEQIKGVSIDQVNCLAEKILDFKQLSVSLVGAVPRGLGEENLLSCML